MNKLEVVSYVPALHQGYLDFFEKHPGNISLLGRDFLQEAPRLERDIRAVDPIVMRRALGSLSIADSVEVLTYDNIEDFVGRAEAVLMPDEDINHQFAETYLPSLPIRFESAFLRWDWQASTAEYNLTPDTIITQAEFDLQMMNLAREEADKSPDWWRQVGGVVIREDRILFKAYNAPYPDPDYDVNTFGDPRSNFEAGEQIEASKVLHCELNIIAQAAHEGVSLEGAHIYVTTFPCPVCARAIAASGIEKVYFKEGYSKLDAADVLGRTGVELVRVIEKEV